VGKGAFDFGKFAHKKYKAHQRKKERESRKSARNIFREAGIDTL